MFCLIVSLFIPVVFAANSCPNIKPISNFNTTAYIQGTWYEVGRFYNNWESHGDCVYLEHKLDGDKITFSLNTVLNHKLSKVEGDIKQDQRDGYIDYNSQAYIASEATSNIPAEILMIDYDKFAVVYFCAYDMKENQHVYTWILSRTKNLDAESMAKVEKLFKSTHFLNLSKITWDHFDDKICQIN